MDTGVTTVRGPRRSLSVCLYPSLGFPSEGCRGEVGPGKSEVGVVMDSAQEALRHLSDALVEEMREVLGPVMGRRP